MKKNIIIVIFVIGLMLSFKHIPIYAAGDERLPDTTKMMVAYSCLEEGQIRYGAPIVTKVKIFDNYDIASMENDKKLLDTPEEFITFTYLSNLSVILEVQGIIQDELPKGKIGGLRLTSMWLKKMAEHPENTDSYQKVINIIR